VVVALLALALPVGPAVEDEPAAAVVAAGVTGRSSYQSSLGHPFIKQFSINWRYKMT
jgi:hypothetical protein